MQDSQIIALYFARDEKAIEETASKYGALCTRIAHNILQNMQDAEECVNDTWLRTWNSIPPASPSVLKTYLAKITRNLALDRYKNTHRAKRGCGEVAIALDEISEITDSGYDVQDAWREQEFISLLNDFLHALPARERNIFVRRYFYTDSVPELARHFGASQASILQSLSRTRKKLKKFLDEVWYEI